MNVCSVKNCRVSFDDNDLNNADAVVFHLQRTEGVQDLPIENDSRPANQRWVFLTDEAPLRPFMSGKIRLKDFNGKFNWSMTYRYTFCTNAEWEIIYWFLEWIRTYQFLTGGRCIFRMTKSISV